MKNPHKFLLDKSVKKLLLIPETYKFKQTGHRARMYLTVSEKLMCLFDVQTMKTNQNWWWRTSIAGSAFKPV